MPRAVILTALPVEYLAVRTHLTDLQEEMHPQGTIYERGKFITKGQAWEVGIAEVGAGNAGAAVEAERAIAYFKPDILFFMGIAGGIKDVAIGDVVAATKVYGYESGKVGEQFFTRPALGHSTYLLVQRAKAEARKGEWLQRLTSSPASQPRVFVAPIAAGEKVIASKQSDIFNFIRASYNDAIAVEMEGFGFLSAAFAYPDIKAIVIRGISDLIEGKNDDSLESGQEPEQIRQQNASHHASAFAFEILAKLQIEEASKPASQQSTLPIHLPESVQAISSDPKTLSNLTNQVLSQKSPQIPDKSSNQSPSESSFFTEVSAMDKQETKPTSKSEIEKLINEFRNSRSTGKRIIPVCGAGFSRHIINQKIELPSWKQLANTLLKVIDCSTEQDAINISLKAKDYLTALTLIQKCNPKQFYDYLQAQFQSKEMKRLKQKHLPLHMSLWSIGFPLVVTTNFDDLLAKARPIAEVYTYQSKGAEDVIQEALKGHQLKPIIFHAHGKITDYKSSESVPILTWREYFKAYGINSSMKDSLVSILTDGAHKNFTRNSERARYEEVLEDVLKESWRSITPTKSAYSGTRLPDIIDDLLTKHTLLLVGFSLDDPSWKLVLLTILSKYSAYPNWTHYYITRNSNEPAPGPGFIPIKLNDWKDLYSTLNTLAVGIYDEKDSKGKYIKGGAENEARNREAKYLSFREKYPNLKWIFQDKDSLVPFVELWSNKTFEKIEVIVEAVNDKTWYLDTEMENLRDEYWKYREDNSIRKGMPLSNERKVRVSSWREIENGICLSVEPVEYKDYLITNHMVANVGEIELLGIAKYDDSLKQRLSRYFSVIGDFSPRNFLCGSEREIALDSKSKCSNHLGISALIIGNFEADTGYKLPVIFCPPSTKQISSPNDIIPSVSGSVDWPVRRDAESEDDIYSLEDIRENPELLNIDKELRREFIEECRWELIEGLEQRSFGYKHHVVLDRHADFEVNELMSNQVIINLCQNIERGGKPELFYLFTLKEEVSMNSFLEDHFQPNWELEKLWSPILNEANTDYLVGPPGLLKIFLLPSPISVKLNLASEYRRAFEVIYKILNNPGYNPVLRAHLASLLLFCKRKFPDIHEEISTTLAPDLAE